jgi:hypothetical protein
VGTVFPVTERVILDTARKHGVGRKLGRVIVFSVDDVKQLYEALPCPSNSSNGQNRRTGNSAAPSGESAYEKAVASFSKNAAGPKSSGPSGKQKSVFRRPDGKPYERPKAKTDNPNHMDRSAGARIRKAFAGAVERAGLGKRVPHTDPTKAKEGATVLETDVTPHVCRHTFATWHYAANRDLGALQRLGGWQSAKMVLRYSRERE